MSAHIEVVINGSPATLPSGSTLVDALVSAGVDSEQPGIAVALGDTVVRRAEWARVQLTTGANIEIVTAVQGG